MLNLKVQSMRRSDGLDALCDSQSTRCFYRGNTAKMDMVLLISKVGVLVHKSKGLNGPYDSSKQDPVSD